MTDKDIKTVYTRDEVKAMIRACLAGIGTSKLVIDTWYFQEDDSIYQVVDDIQEQFSQILRILNFYIMNITEEE